MAHGFNVVAVRVTNKRTVVIGVVLRPHPRFVEYDGPSIDTRREEAVNSSTIRCVECDMGFPKAVAGHIRANPEIGHRGNAVADRGAVKLENSLTPTATRTES